MKRNTGAEDRDRQSQIGTDRHRQTQTDIDKKRQRGQTLTDITDTDRRRQTGRTLTDTDIEKTNNNRDRLTSIGETQRQTYIE
jgi:hypothetical protein